MDDDNWPLRGLCRDQAALSSVGLVADDWFRETRRVVTTKAKDFCVDCPVMFPCLDKARSEGIPYGVFGGEDKNEREDWWAANGGRPPHFEESLAMDLSPVREDREEAVA